MLLARKRPVEITVEELERIDPGDVREIEALRHNIRQLHHESRKAQESAAWLERERAALSEQVSTSPEVVRRLGRSQPLDARAWSSRAYASSARKRWPRSSE